MSEYEAVVKAVDTIMSFLYTHEKSSTTSMWESDIDGTTLKTDWGYFEQGLNEIKWYCTELESNVMPSADRPQGEWIWKERHINRNYIVKGTDSMGEPAEVYVHEDRIEKRNYCSECGKLGDDIWLNYCPHCGAYMRKGADDE